MPSQPEQETPPTKNRKPLMVALVLVASVSVIMCCCGAGIGSWLAFPIYGQPVIVGNWKSLQEEGTVEFRRDGTCTWRNSEFKWRVEESNLLIISGGVRDLHFRFRHDGDTLTLTPISRELAVPIVMTKVN